MRIVKANLHLTDSEIGKLLGTTAEKVTAFRHRHRMLKPNNYQFQKGMIPWNKGVSYDAGGKDTRFKKGQMPVTTKYDGCISLRHDDHRPYYYIRLALKKWKPLHRHIWEQHHGPIPAGHIIIFKDKNTMNCHIDNLRCITRQQHIKRNHNRAKASQSLRLNWEYCRRKEEAGIRTTRHHQIKRYDGKPINWQSGINRSKHAISQ